MKENEDSTQDGFENFCRSQERGDGLVTAASKREWILAPAAETLREGKCAYGDGGLRSW